MKIGLICGDGLPVSGLLTVFRNVFHLGRSMGVFDDTVVADLGYSWRSDKTRFFPDGPDPHPYPPWLRPTTNHSIAGLGRAGLSAELEDIRRSVAAFGRLGEAERQTLVDRIETLRQVYFDHFKTWLQRHDPDWVFAVNLTLPHAVSVTSALFTAADLHYRARPGGLVIWDHDLCGSNGRWDTAIDRRFYPSVPNAVTPLPAEAAHVNWIVVSQGLAREAESYDTAAQPEVIANLLPVIPPGIDERHHEFARQLELCLERPILVSPVRIYRVKGVNQSLRFHAELVGECLRRSLAPPYLLVFGDLDEDPDYGDELVALRDELATTEYVRFLGGVPLETVRGADGDWRLDEVDLLRLARATHGGVVFTPSVSDFETIGLGAALAAAAEIPAVSTRYSAFDEVYGAAGISCTTFETDGSGMTEAAVEFVDVLAAFAGHDADLAADLRRNRHAVESLFPAEPWRALLDSMNGGTATSCDEGQAM